MNSIHSAASLPCEEGSPEVEDTLSEGGQGALPIPRGGRAGRGTRASGSQFRGSDPAGRNQDA
ncbi:MAG: hypothetical protein CMG22_04085 [Candidatus Marinimicrobia bacterium]|nr:hypothetical protein [Candidatus Neomarinimicrobiota bacterium]